MTYKDLKKFCDSLAEDQLNQEVYVAITDGESYKVSCGNVTKKYEWWDFDDCLGDETEMKIEFGDDWEERSKEFTKVSKGTVLLISE